MATLPLTVLQGADRDDLLNTLSSVIGKLTNTQSANDFIDGYVTWADDAAGALRHLIASEDVDRLVRTRRFWMIHSAPTATRAVYTSVRAEIDDRQRVLEELLDQLRQVVEEWRVPDVFVLPDTSFYIGHDEKIENADFRTQLKISDAPVRVLIPMVVIDELDKLKGAGQQHTRWRAGHTLGVFDSRLTGRAAIGELRPADFTAVDQQTGGIPSGQVTVEVLFDRPDHRRLPIADDEIVDRAVAAQSLIGKPLTLITYDTGQSTRARRAGLHVVKLDHPRPPEEPRH